jgi:hypothetical protein
VITKGDHIGTGSQELLGQGLGKAPTTRGVLRVRHDKINLAGLLHPSGHPGKRASPGSPNYIPYHQYFH